MASIEVITSQEKEVKMKKITGEPYTVLIKVWNETVSNLTLMALGYRIIHGNHKYFRFICSGNPFVSN